MVGIAFGISTDDVANVLSHAGIDADDSRCEELFDQLDFEEIEAAALSGFEMDEQTEYAYEEIRRQLTDLGVMAAEAELSP